MARKQKSRSAPSPAGVTIPVVQQTVSVRVVEHTEREPQEEVLHTVASLMAHVINTPGIPGRVLDRTVSALHSLPPWLSPLTGLIGLSVRNSLGILEALPAVRRKKIARAEKPEATQRTSSVQKIEIK